MTDRFQVVRVHDVEEWRIEDSQAGNGVAEARRSGDNVVGERYRKGH